MKIQFNNFSYSYNKNDYVLQDINLTINDQDFVAIVGHNGSGKSTLIKSLVKLKVEPNDSIYINDTDINKFSEWNKIGYVEQHFHEFSFNFPLSVEEVLKSSLNNKDKINSVLKEMDIEDLRHKNINKLSGGMRQRVFIARALLHDPELIILDEPFVGIDEKNTKLIYEILKQLNNSGKTIILITHQKHSIKTLVNKVLVLNKKVFYYGITENYDERMCELC